MALIRAYPGQSLIVGDAYGQTILANAAAAFDGSTMTMQVSTPGANPSVSTTLYYFDTPSGYTAIVANLTAVYSTVQNGRPVTIASSAVSELRGVVGTFLLFSFPVSTTAAALTGLTIQQLLAGVDQITGDQQDDVLYGYGGNDTLDPGRGTDVVDGGTGFNTVSYADPLANAYAVSTQGVSISLSAGFAVDTGGNIDTLVNIQGVTGSAFADVIGGDAGGNILNGAAGDDTIYGLGGDDLLIGGAGADRLDGGDGNDTASYQGSGAALWARLDLGAAAGGDADGDRLSFIENIVGTSFGDLITGDGGANILNGGAGDDTLDGAGGDDTLIGAAGSDIIQGGEGSDIIDERGDWVGAYFNVLLGEGGNDFIYGGSTQQAFAGYNISDYIVGGDGADTISGNDGDDIIHGDRVDAQGAAVGAGNDVISGGAGNDVIYGAGGNDTIDGGANVDVIYGGDGDDIITDPSTDLPFFNMSIFDGNGNFLIGEGGNDTITGASNGGDFISGGPGDDVLTGGTGAGVYQGDIFGFDAGSGYDVITDFQHGFDRVTLQSNLNGSGITTAAEAYARVSDFAGVARLDLGGGHFVVFGGLTTAQLGSGDFTVF